MTRFLLLAGLLFGATSAPAEEEGSELTAEALGLEEKSFLESGEHRLVLELATFGTSPAPTSLNQPGDVVWGKQPLSGWWGGRVGLLRTEGFGLTWGADVTAALNREDNGNSYVGEVRSRGRVDVRGLAGYRLGLGGSFFTPYVLAGVEGQLGVRQLGVLDDDRIAPLFGGSASLGFGLMVEVWRFSLRLDAGLFGGLAGIGSFGAFGLGFVI